jgi:predicted Ser/Thr protein kinase
MTNCPGTSALEIEEQALEDHEEDTLHGVADRYARQEGLYNGDTSSEDVEDFFQLFDTLNDVYDQVWASYLEVLPPERNFEESDRILNEAREEIQDIKYEEIRQAYLSFANEVEREKPSREEVKDTLTPKKQSEEGSGIKHKLSNKYKQIVENMKTIPDL